MRQERFEKMEETYSDVSEHPNFHEGVNHFEERLFEGGLKDVQVLLSSIEQVTNVLLGGNPASGISGVTLAFLEPANNFIPEGRNFRYLSSSEISQMLNLLYGEGSWNPQYGDFHISLANSSLTLDWMPNSQNLSYTFSESDSTRFLKWAGEHSDQRRNGRCLCISGKKFKNCCGKSATQSMSALMAFSKTMSTYTDEAWVHIVRIAEMNSEEFEDKVLNSTDPIPELFHPLALKWFHLATYLHGVDEYEKALSCYEKIRALGTEEDSQRSNISIKIGECLIGLGRNTEALKAVEGFNEIGPTDVWQRLRLGKIYWAAGSFKASAEEFESLTLEFPQNRDITATLANLFVELPHPLAEHYLELCKATFKNETWVAYLQTRFLGNAGRLGDFGDEQYDWVYDLTDDEYGFSVNFPLLPTAAHRPVLLKAMHFLEHVKTISIHKIERYINQEDYLGRISGLLQESYEEVGWEDGVTEHSEHQKGHVFLTLIVVSANLGLTGLCEQTLEKICQECLHEAFDHPLAMSFEYSCESLLALAYSRAGSHEEAIKYLDQCFSLYPDKAVSACLYIANGLSAGGEDKQTLDILQLAIKHNRKDQHIFQSLGDIHQKLGNWAQSLEFYRSEVDEHHSIGARGRVIILNLLLKDLSGAKKAFSDLMMMLAEPEILLSELKPVWDGYQPVETDGDQLRLDYQNGIMPEPNVWDKFFLEQSELYGESFDELFNFCASTLHSPTYANDVIDKAKTLEVAKMGIETWAELDPNRYSELHLDSTFLFGNETDDKELRFLSYIENSGDYSLFQNSLESEMNSTEHLPDRAFISLLEGERIFLSERVMHDYTGMVIAYAKAVEITLLSNVFNKFRRHAHVDLELKSEVSLKYSDSSGKIFRFARYLADNPFFELGGMELVLRYCNGRTATQEPIISHLRQFIRDDLRLEHLLEPTVIEDLGKIARDYRNPHVHSDIIGRSDAVDCRRICLSVLNIFNEQTGKMPSAKAHL